MRDFTSEEKSALIRALCEGVSDIVFFKSPSGAFLYANHAFERLYGYTLDQLYGKTDFDFLIREEAEYFAARDKDAFDAGKPMVSEGWQLNDLTGQRECYETTKTPVYADDGRLLGLLGVVKNITDLKP